MTSKTLGILTALVALLGSACSAEPSDSARPKFAVEFQITNDDGQALRGVTVDAGKTRVGTTAANGLLEAELSGDEGQTIAVAVSCPEGFSNPQTVEPLRLTRTLRINGDGYQPLRVEVVCRRRLRDLVIVVRAHEGAGLPLLVDGKPAGITDGDGIAHVLVKADRATPSISLTLDTAAAPDLKPKNPSRTFDLSGNDALLVVDQAFVSTPKRVFRTLPAQVKKHVPYRVD